MPKPVNNFLATIKQFKTLFLPANIKKATTEDLLALKEALEMGINVLNNQVQLLSTISVVNNQQRNSRYVQQQKQQIIEPATELVNVAPITNFDVSSVSLYDAEAEARQANESYLNSQSVTEEDEVQLLNEVFSSIEDGTA